MNTPHTQSNALLYYWQQKQNLSADKAARERTVVKECALAKERLYKEFHSKLNPTYQLLLNAAHTDYCSLASLLEPVFAHLYMFNYEYLIYPDCGLYHGRILGISSTREASEVYSVYNALPVHLSELFCLWLDEFFASPGITKSFLQKTARAIELLERGRREGW